MNYTPHKMSAKFIIALFLIAAIPLFLTFCSDNQLTTESEGVQQEIVLDKSNPEVQRIMAIQDRFTEDVMKRSDVVGTATGLTEDGKLAVLVLTEEEVTFETLSKQANPIPQTIENVPVRLYYTGKIVAMKPDKPGKPGDGGNSVDHQAKQTTPIQLGTSGGWSYDLANGYCCGGTLGSLIQIGGSKYILSNYHVLEADIVSGGNNRTASTGDPVIQPALIDVNCDASNAQEVATLDVREALPNSNVDAAIAQIIPGMVSEDGAILEVGTLSATTTNAFIGQAVKKSGRTTGLTRSSIDGLNATISVSYENECAGGTAFTKTFTGQIVIKNKRSKFLDGGDSGSLMVEDIASNPKAVGLLFAGSSRTAIANPIDEVLNFFNASMVGN